MSYKRPLILDNGTFREIRDGEYPFNTSSITDIIDQFIVFNETPECDIANIRLFTTANPFKETSLCVYLNGIRLKNGVDNDFTVVSYNQFLLNDIIDYIAADSILVDYKRSDLGI